MFQTKNVHDSFVQLEIVFSFIAIKNVRARHVDMETIFEVFIHKNTRDKMCTPLIFIFLFKWIPH